MGALVGLPKTAAPSVPTVREGDDDGGGDDEYGKGLLVLILGETDPDLAAVRCSPPLPPAGEAVLELRDKAGEGNLSRISSGVELPERVGNAHGATVPSAVTRRSRVALSASSSSSVRSSLVLGRSESVVAGSAQRRTGPKRKCCTTGKRSRTSCLYRRRSPSKLLSEEASADVVAGTGSPCRCRREERNRYEMPAAPGGATSNAGRFEGWTAGVGVFWCQYTLPVDYVAARRYLERKAACSPKRATRLTPGLGRLPVVHQVVVLVHSPDAHLAGGFEPERLVHLLHHVEVDRKRLACQGGLVLGREGADEAEDQEEREEREFVAGAVVETGRRAERGPEVEREFGDRDVLRRRERLVVQTVGFLCAGNAGLHQSGPRHVLPERSTEARHLGRTWASLSSQAWNALPVELGDAEPSSQSVDFFKSALIRLTSCSETKAATSAFVPSPKDSVGWTLVPRIAIRGECWRRASE
jgi:hypothetical protein